MRLAWAAAGLGLVCLTGCTPGAKGDGDLKAEAVKLCGLEADPYAASFDVEPGMYSSETLKVPQGANALRLDANFYTFGNDPKWASTVSLLLTTTTGKYVLRYNKWSKDKTLRVETETGTEESTTTEHDFDASPALGDYLLADMSWTPDGVITTTIYADEDGRDGVGESHAFKGGVPKSVEVLVSTAEADVNALSFGHVCAADEVPGVSPVASPPPPVIQPRVTTLDAFASSQE